MADRYPLTRQLCTMLKGDRSFHRRWEIVLADNETSPEKPPFYIRRFFLILVLLGLLGGFLALTVPLWRSWAEMPKTNCIEFIIGWVGSLLSSFIPPSDADKYPDGKVIADVRLHILYITGGIIAILTLLQTNWKNQVDHRKVKDDIQKNKNDHIRQVHAERRERYATAVEQLANEKAAVRLGGVYTLIGLVDEWLDDNKSLTDNNRSSDKSKKEGQIIVNSLCAYIKSPLETENKTTTSHITGQEERGIRQAILHEIHTRLHSKNSSSEPEEYKPGPWSKFSFDFSNSEFFYPVDFSNGFFEENINFTESKFTESVNFKNARFKESAIFNSAKFMASSANSCASFENSNFSNKADFSSSVFTIPLIFKNATFNGELRLNESQFILVTLYAERTVYYSEPIVDPELRDVDLVLSVDRRLKARDEEYPLASFSGATFNNGFTMQGARSEGIIDFVNDSEKATKFSYRIAPLKYNFKLHWESFQIETDEIISPDGKSFTIPKGCVIFDPDNSAESAISASEQVTEIDQKIIGFQIINMLFP